MNCEAISIVMQHSAAKGTDKLVLLGLATHADSEGYAFPSHETLAKYANVDERNVRRAITRLVDSGELGLEVHGGIGRKDRKTNRYQILVTCLGPCRHDWAPTPSRDDENAVHEGALAPSDSYSYVANSSQVLAGCTYVQPSNTSGAPINSKEKEIDSGEEEFVFMPWPGLDHEDNPRRDDEVGAIGKIEDKAAKRQAKYKKTKFEAVPARMRRHERPEETWTTEDLVAEFYELTRESAPGVPGQINGRQLSTWMNARVGEGVPRIALLGAIRRFFNDPRLVRDPGVGTPLWRRFVAFYPTIHGKVVTASEDPVDEDLLALQKKALDRLMGD